MLEHLKTLTIDCPVTWKLKFSNDRAFGSSHLRAFDCLRSRLFECSGFGGVAFSIIRLKSNFRMLGHLKARNVERPITWKLKFSKARVFESSHFRALEYLKNWVFECSSFWEIAFSNIRMIEKNRIFECSIIWKRSFSSAWSPENSGFRMTELLKARICARSSVWNVDFSSARGFER